MPPSRPSRPPHAVTIAAPHPDDEIDDVSESFTRASTRATIRDKGLWPHQQGCKEPVTWPGASGRHVYGQGWRGPIGVGPSSVSSADGAVPTAPAPRDLAEQHVEGGGSAPAPHGHPSRGWRAERRGPGRGLSPHSHASCSGSQSQRTRFFQGERSDDCQQVSKGPSDAARGWSCERGRG